ncbi:hypothetical protein [Castellaniella sp.]|uniref:hypothetical protein n=1 Tax=Castellaniella sp. TaxID=1955812 RepID=UPI002AFF0085|nr:hypothetical protein [Castellaniella sp.]
MKLKIIERGYENFSGLLGITFFTDAVSDDDVNHKEAVLLASLVRVADAETGQPVSAFDQERAVWNTAVSQPAPLQPARTQPKAAPVANTPVATVKQYTRENLEELADKGGINALRKVGNEFNVKNASIAGLIDEILQAQDAKVN